MDLHERINQKDSEGNFILSPLSYTDDHLEPFIGESTVRWHYWKHLQGYIDRVSSLKKAQSLNLTIEGIIEEESLRKSGLYQNASQVFNHYFYFEQLNPKGASEPLFLMNSLIERHYSSWGNLKDRIMEVGLSVFGSGWVFLTTDSEGKQLWVRTFSGTGTPIAEHPLLALDVWEHAYYLDYHNNRSLYIENFFMAIDWSVIENRICKIRENFEV